VCFHYIFLLSKSIIDCTNDLSFSFPHSNIIFCISRMASRDLFRASKSLGFALSSEILFSMASISDTSESCSLILARIMGERFNSSMKSSLFSISSFERRGCMRFFLRVLFPPAVFVADRTQRSVPWSSDLLEKL
jgi:hypothetical protein